MKAFTCDGCKNRTATCHATCKKYLAELAAHKKEKERIRKLEEIESFKGNRRVEKRAYELRKYGRSVY